jgi:hypothetical protein
MILPRFAGICDVGELSSGKPYILYRYSMMLSGNPCQVARLPDYRSIGGDGPTFNTCENRASRFLESVTLYLEKGFSLTRGRYPSQCM